jgi:hypothetical protein
LPNRFINGMPPNGVTALSEYSMGRFTITVFQAVPASAGVSVSAFNVQ